MFVLDGAKLYYVKVQGKTLLGQVCLERYNIFEKCWQPLFGFLGIYGLINLETMTIFPIPFRSHNVVGNDLGTIHIGVSPLKLHRDRFSFFNSKCSTRKSQVFFQLDRELDISLYRMEATALHHSN